MNRLIDNPAAWVDEYIRVYGVEAATAFLADLKEDADLAVAFRHKLGIEPVRDEQLISLPRWLIKQMFGPEHPDYIDDFCCEHCGADAWKPVAGEPDGVKHEDGCPIPIFHKALGYEK